MNRRMHLVVPAFLSAALLLAIVPGCGSDSGEFGAPENLPAETTSTVVFYSTGRSLVQERVVVDAENSFEATLLEMLKADPSENEDIAIVQTTAPVLSVSFDEDAGTVTVDWDAEVLAFDAEPSEKRLALASILMTLGQFPEVEKVRFTVDGQESGTVDGKDIVAFWGDVSLIDQPFEVLRPPVAGGSDEASDSAGATETTSP